MKTFQFTGKQSRYFTAEVNANTAEEAQRIFNIMSTNDMDEIGELEWEQISMKESGEEVNEKIKDFGDILIDNHKRVWDKLNNGCKGWKHGDKFTINENDAHPQANTLRVKNGLEEYEIECGEIRSYR